MAAFKDLAIVSAENRRAPSLPVTATRIALLVGLVAGTVYLLFDHSKLFNDPLAVKSQIVAFGVWGPIVFMLLYAVGPSLLVPGAVMTLAGGLAFGALHGAIYSLLGADLGALVAFAAGRFLGRELVERLVTLRFRPFLDKVAHHGFEVIFYLRLLPLIPYNALNLLAGASPISFRDYMLASLVGLIPGTVLFAFLGNSLWHPGSPSFFLALGLIALCFSAGEYYRRSFKNVAD